MDEWWGRRRKPLADLLPPFRGLHDATRSAGDAASGSISGSISKPTATAIAIAIKAQGTCLKLALMVFPPYTVMFWNRMEEW
jgi:hypothetical protein